ITKKAKKSSYVFQQDGAPAHRPCGPKTWPKNSVAPQSPDLNPLDFSICGINVNDLKTSVNKVWRSMRKVYVADVCRAFRGRLEAVIEAKEVKFINNSICYMYNKPL
ncbi:Putative transposable element, partial [Caligus rogercresseyi]